MFRKCVVTLTAISAEDLSAAFKVLGFNYSPPVSTSEKTLSSISPFSSNNSSEVKSSVHGILSKHREVRKSGKSEIKPTIEQIRRQYRELARLHHPDLGGGDDSRMKVINTAYELIQSSGVLQATPEDSVNTAQKQVYKQQETWRDKRFAQKAGARRRRVPDDFANGDDSSWVMKSSLDWHSFINSTDGLTAEEMRNPANHPFTHSKFFTFEDDATIYRMLRGGATIPQVGRTLGKPATFIEKRIHNAQFKARVQYLLRAEKRQGTSSSSSQTTVTPTMHSKSYFTNNNKNKKHNSHSDAEVVTTAAPRGANHVERLFRNSPFEDTTSYPIHKYSTHNEMTNAAQLNKMTQKKKEWEATFPSWRASEYFDTMTMEEKARYAHLLNNESHYNFDSTNSSNNNNIHDLERKGGWVNRPVNITSASKMSRSYANFTRLHPSQKTREETEVIE